MPELKFNPKKILILDIDEVRPNSWNPKHKNTQEFRDIKRGIKEKGLVAPIHVRKNYGYEIVDGEQRWTACKELGYTNILVYNLGKMNKREAKEMTIWLQEQVPFAEEKLAKLVKEIVNNSEPFMLPFSEEEIDVFLEMDGSNILTALPDESDVLDDITEEHDGASKILRVTEEQHKIIKQAIKKVRKEVGDDVVSSDGRCLELISGDYLAG